MRRRYRVWPLLAVAACVVAFGAAEETALDGRGGEIAPVHRDPDGLLEAVLQTTRAFLAEDAQAARAALDRVTASTRRLDREEDGGYGSQLLTYDQAFHVTIDRARELSSAGQLEDAFNQFVFVQRACITCHGLAREQGLLVGGSLGEKVN